MDDIDEDVVGFQDSVAILRALPHRATGIWAPPMRLMSRSLELSDMVSGT